MRTSYPTNPASARNAGWTLFPRAPWRMERSRKKPGVKNTDDMLTRLIDFSLKNKFIVLVTTVALVLGGVYAVKNIPLDAIPDLSDVQVIIYTEWPGQAPQIVQDQVTYPITTKMLSVPKAKVV